jgi:hypothetical protein
MHIAHPRIGEVITVEQLAELVGLKRRQIAYLAPDIPGAIRPDGYHYEYRVTPELLDWIEWKRRKIQRRKRCVKTAKPKPTAAGVITLHGLRQEFDIWLRRIGALHGILRLPPEHRRDIVLELQPMARLYSQLIGR